MGTVWFLVVYDQTKNGFQSNGLNNTICSFALKWDFLLRQPHRQHRTYDSGSELEGLTACSRHRERDSSWVATS